MTPASALRAQPPAAPPAAAPEGEHHACCLRTTCQPPSAWCKEPWPATIRDISTAGLSLTLERRFERGSGLAIELPGDDGATSTVLARVVGVQADPEGGWALRCALISELSDEEVQAVLHLDQLAHATATVEGATPADPAARAAVAGVLFQARLYSGTVARWYVKHLDLAGAWPPALGASVTLRVGTPDAPPLELVVKQCVPVGDAWLVNCKFRTQPSAELLRAIGHAP